MVLLAPIPAHFAPHLNPLVPLLAQQPARSGDATSQVVLWAGIFLVLLIVGAVVVLLMRRTLFSKEDPSQATGGLMESMRKLRNEGLMTEEEFQAARRAMTNRTRAELDALPPKPTAPAKNKTRK
jgi:hypothetical protein